MRLKRWAANVLECMLLHLVKSEFPTEVIIAYVPKDKVRLKK